MACDLGDELRAALDEARSIPGILGLRPFDLFVRVRTWSGTRAGLGTKTDVDTDILTDGYRPRVEHLSNRDIVASGGLYTDEDLKITVTPAYSGVCGTGGTAPEVFDPDVSSSPQEIFFNIKGIGHPVGGHWYKKISEHTDSVLTYFFIIRKTAEVL